MLRAAAAGAVAAAAAASRTRRKAGAAERVQQCAGEKCVPWRAEAAVKRAG